MTRAVLASFDYDSTMIVGECSPVVESGVVMADHNSDEIGIVICHEDVGARDVHQPQDLY